VEKRKIRDRSSRGKNKVRVGAMFSVTVMAVITAVAVVTLSACSSNGSNNSEQEVAVAEDGLEYTNDNYVYVDSDSVIENEGYYDAWTHCSEDTYKDSEIMQYINSSDSIDTVKVAKSLSEKLSYTNIKRVSEFRNETVYKCKDDVELYVSNSDNCNEINVQFNVKSKSKLDERVEKFRNVITDMINLDEDDVSVVDECINTVVQSEVPYNAYITFGDYMDGFGDTVENCELMIVAEANEGKYKFSIRARHRI
jgi:hypothetical protein